MNAGRLVLLALGAAGLGAGVWLLSRRSEETAAETASAVASGGSFRARLTGYWPTKATASEREKKMEGGNTDRRSKPLHSLQQHMADPKAHPYAAVAGDDAIFPYGQRITLDVWPDAVFRVVDTGSHFRGSRKIYRALGREPLDVRVESAKSKVPTYTAASIIRGDHFDQPSREVTVSKFKDQIVTAGRGLDFLGAQEAW